METQYQMHQVKGVDNKLQDLVEQSLGVNGVKTMKETGINRYRQAGDLLTSLDHSAWTSFQSDKYLIQQKHIAIKNNRLILLQAIPRKHSGGLIQIILYR